jgi:hypothetical protein
MADRQILARDIDALAKRIEARAHEFRNNGEFAHLQDKLDWFTERHQRLRGKLNGAREGAWDRIKDDLAREHGALYDDFVAFERELDAEAMREHPHGRAPGARSGLV